MVALEARGELIALLRETALIAEVHVALLVEPVDCGPLPVLPLNADVRCGRIPHILALVLVELVFGEETLHHTTEDRLLRRLRPSRL